MDRYKCIDECINELGSSHQINGLVGAINLDGVQCAPYDVMVAGDAPGLILNGAHPTGYAWDELCLTTSVPVREAHTFLQW